MNLDCPLDRLTREDQMFYDPKIEAHAVTAPMKSAPRTLPNVDADTLARLNKYLAHVDAGYAAVKAKRIHGQTD